MCCAPADGTACTRTRVPPTPPLSSLPTVPAATPPTRWRAGSLSSRAARRRRALVLPTCTRALQPPCGFSAASVHPIRIRSAPLAHALSARYRRQASAADQRAHSFAGRGLDPALEHACLLIDPTPGTCVVFPSFVPHLVLPTPAVGAAAAAPLRLSLAFNFGACDPVMAHVLVLSGRDGTVRVKLVLEIVDVV